MNNKKLIQYLLGIFLIIFISCSKKPIIIHIDKLFTLLPTEFTHLKFNNSLVGEKSFNVFKYRNYYNSGGVAIGDVNNDGVPDAYLESTA